jgi:hypothetical protein
VPTEAEKPAIAPSETRPEPADADTPVPAEAGPDQATAQGEQKPPPEKPPTEDDDPNAPDPTEGELRKLRPETRRRFERLLAQRNEARQSFEAIKPELDQHRQLQGYLQQHQLAPDDVNLLLGVGAALRRGDYQAFLDGVTPYVMAAQEAIGARIATDLQKQVEDGLVTEDVARELTRTRHAANQAQHRLREQTQSVTTDAQTRSVQDIRAGVDEWERGIRTRDPDYPHKAVAIRRFSQALLTERGYPQNRQEAVALAQAAYEEASREIARFRPRPVPTSRQPSSGNHVATGGAAPEIRTLKDAVLGALAQTRRAS